MGLWPSSTLTTLLFFLMHTHIISTKLIKLITKLSKLQSYCSLPPHLTYLVAIAFMWSLGLTLHLLSRASYVHSPWWIFLFFLAFLLMVLWPSSTSSPLLLFFMHTPIISTKLVKLIIKLSKLQSYCSLPPHLT
jgi:hypothetical protein